MAVPALLERAISNMLDNALKWSPPAAPFVEVVDGSVTVRDDGPGISLDERERVFERFYRSEDAKSSPGSGLGLSIVRRVWPEFWWRCANSRRRRSRYSGETLVTADQLKEVGSR